MSRMGESLAKGIFRSNYLFFLSSLSIKVLFDEKVIYQIHWNRLKTIFKNRKNQDLEKMGKFIVMNIMKF